MSGGVDSSVAAALLKEAGHEVIGITMRLWTERRPEAFRGRTQCCGIEDIDDARRVAQRLDIPHYTLNLEKPFRRFVVDNFVAEYAQGRTPNPCLNCNTFIKFDAFLERALALQADYMATGHYARRVERDGVVELHRARDAAKDQSYVLYTLSQEALARALFPLGDLPKPEVRAIAARYGLAVAEKPDSTDICFVPGGDYREFVRRHVPDRPGVFQDAAGVVVGEHAGVQHFTVGQRRHLGGGFRPVPGEPVFVTAIEPESNVVRLGSREDLRVGWLELEDVRWLCASPPFVAPEGVAAEGASPMGEAPPREERGEEDGVIRVQVRAHGKPVAAVVRPRVVGAGGVRARVELGEALYGVAPGQAAVLYAGERVLGGGTIVASGSGHGGASGA